jgi:hypothetical protein
MLIDILIVFTIVDGNGAFLKDGLFVSNDHCWFQKSSKSMFLVYFLVMVLLVGHGIGLLILI